MVIIALLAAGAFLWRVRQSLGDELRWAQQAEASLEAESTGYGDPRAVEAVQASSATVAENGPDLAQLQRLRIPALGFDEPLSDNVQEQQQLAAEGDALLLDLPVAWYGDEVCRLDQLQPGDTIYLEGAALLFSYQVVDRQPARDGSAGADGHQVVLSAYPCGAAHEQVLVSATRAFR